MIRLRTYPLFIECIFKLLYQQSFCCDCFLFYLVNMSLIPNIKFKTEYCHSWEQGKVCEKGYACFFAHGEHDLRTIQQNHADIISQNFLTPTLANKPHNYKTIFCKFYAEGTCKLGDQCTYAHERREKRKKSASQQYLQKEQQEANLSRGNHQLYQYYTQAYLPQYYQANYFYEAANENSIEEAHQNEVFEEEGGNFPYLLGQHNIKDLTYNQPIPIDANTELQSQSSKMEIKGEHEEAF